MYKLLVLISMCIATCKAEIAEMLTALDQDLSNLIEIKFFKYIKIRNDINDASIDWALILHNINKLQGKEIFPDTFGNDNKKNNPLAELAWDIVYDVEKLETTSQQIFAEIADRAIAQLEIVKKGAEEIRGNELLPIPYLNKPQSGENVLHFTQQLFQKLQLLNSDTLWPNKEVFHAIQPLFVKIIPKVEEIFKILEEKKNKRLQEQEEETEEEFGA